MLALLAALVIGTCAGLASALPGVHVTILLIGLLPLLAMNGPAGAVALVSAIGSGMIASNLAKTFHPTTADTIKSATPEQLLAYRGEGRKALGIQNQAVWAGTSTVMVLACLLIPIKLLVGGDLRHAIDFVMKPMTVPLILLFLILTTLQAKHRIPTVIVLALATTLGFFVMQMPTLAGNPNSLAPLLSGGFVLPALAMVIFHTGIAQPFPTQHKSHWKPQPAPLQIWGALGGIVMAMAAGLGSGGAVSVFADKVTHDEYLGMHTASEAANHVFAVLLFLVVGSTHSGAGVALKQQLLSPGIFMIILLLFAIVLSLAFATNVCERFTDAYVQIVAKLPQRGLAIVVASITLLLVVSETGPLGVIVAFAAGALGLVAKLNFVPNQAMVAVLTGPVLLYYIGLSGPFAKVLGLMH